MTIPYISIMKLSMTICLFTAMAISKVHAQVESPEDSLCKHLNEVIVDFNLMLFYGGPHSGLAEEIYPLVTRALECQPVNHDAIMLKINLDTELGNKREVLNSFLLLDSLANYENAILAYECATQYFTNAMVTEGNLAADRALRIADATCDTTSSMQEAINCCFVYQDLKGKAHAQKYLNSKADLFEDDEQFKTWYNVIQSTKEWDLFNAGYRDDN